MSCRRSDQTPPTMQNTSTSHGSGDGNEWAVQNMLLDQCLAEEEEEDEYVEYVNNNDDMNVGMASNESGGSGKGKGKGRASPFPNPAMGIKARGGVRRRSRTNRASSRKTTLVKANPANFRDLVQQFTGCHSQLPYPHLPLQGKGPINLNFSRYTSTTTASTPITYHHPTNISTSTHHLPPPPPLTELQQQQGGHNSDPLNFSFPTANDATIAAAAAICATDHTQPPPWSLTSLSSDHGEMKLGTPEEFTMWETQDQYHYY